MLNLQKMIIKVVKTGPVKTPEKRKLPEMRRLLQETERAQRLHLEITKLRANRRVLRLKIIKNLNVPAHRRKITNTRTINRTRRLEMLGIAQ